MLKFVIPLFMYNQTKATMDKVEHKNLFSNKQKLS